MSGGLNPVNPLAVKSSSLWKRSLGLLVWDVNVSVFPFIFVSVKIQLQLLWSRDLSLQRHVFLPTFLDVLLYLGAGSDHPDLRGDERAALRCRHRHLSRRLSKQPPLVRCGKPVSPRCDGWDSQLGLQRGRAAHTDLASDDGASIGQGEQGGPCSPQSWLWDSLQEGAVMKEGSHCTAAVLSLS